MSYLKVIPNITLVVAKANSGKSHAIKHMCYKLKSEGRINEIFVFAGTAFNNDYDYVGKKNVTSHYTDNKLKTIVRWQMERINKGKGKPILVIFDDCMDLTKQFNKKFWKKLISEYRHYNITFIFSIQYIKGVGPLFRTLARYVIFFKMTDKMSLQCLHESFLTEFDDWKDVKKFVMKHTSEKYTFILADMYSDEDKKYTLLKAPAELPNYKLG